MAVVQRAHHIHHAHLVRLQLHRIHIHLDLPVLAAEGLRHRGARYVCDLVANIELAEIVKLGLVQSFSFKSDQADGQAGSVELENHRRQGAGGQPSQLRHRQVGNRADGRVRTGARLEIDLDQADAGQRARFDVVDAAAQREEALEGIGDVGFHFFWGHTGIKRGHDHHRNVDRGKQIYGHACHGHHPDHGHDQADHDDEEGILDGKARHYSRPPSSILASAMRLGLGSTRCPGW